MRTLIAAALALALTGGAASAQYYNPYGANVYVYAPPPIRSPFGDPNLQWQALSGAGAANVEAQQLRNQILREQLRQMQQR
jgi:hypothetical protein